MNRASWGSRIGFIFAVAGSAVGLANIWRFPYVVGSHGGSAFVMVYLLSVFLIGFPVLIAEMLIGITTQTSPSGAFGKLGGSSFWKWVGRLTIVTGFIVSAFYSVVAGWILGYLFEAVRGNLTSFASTGDAAIHFNRLTQNPLWSVGCHAIFLSLSTMVLYFGVRNGIERGNKIMMPMLFVLLILLVVKGLTLEGATKGLSFLFQPDWSALTPAAFLAALGQSFFTLSLGQGTMVTYGSYLTPRENLLKGCVPVVLMDTVISLLAAIAVFTIVFSAGLTPDSGPGLIFHTIPLVFSEIPGGHFLAILFFLLIVLAALTSEISALEPAIAYLMDEKGWKRHQAVLVCGTGAFLLGLPCALSSSILDKISSLCSDWLIPFGGFMAVVLVGWAWGFPSAIKKLREGSEGLFGRYPWIETYFWFCIKFAAPLLIIIVFLHTLGVFG
jgi:NSS family neurotransmitter:Na+ symporter